MELSHKELKYLNDNLLPDNVKHGIELFFQQDIDDLNYYYVTDCLWKTDQELGGIGAYAMPSDPCKNPFPGGEKRSLYRSLQYARSSIDICDVRRFARDVIRNSGMHLEAVCRKYIDGRPEKFRERLPKHTMLGKAIQKINIKEEIEPIIKESFEQFVTIYNMSKHEINQDESRERMFNAKDAIVFYFSARILGLYLLQRMNCEDSFRQYEIKE